MRILAISDIHGCLNTFKALLRKINYSKEDQLFLLGDFIDRGFNSKGVIDHILDLQNAGYTIYCLKGNHEQMLTNSILHSKDTSLWLHHGGKETLSSFGVNDIYDIPKKYISWMEELLMFYEYENYIFVHAGLNFDIPNPLEGLHSMLWIRAWYRDINYEWLKNRIIVHGHTPSSKQEIEENFQSLDYIQAIDIDAGCVFKSQDLQLLCAIDLTNRQLYFERRVKGD